MTTELRPFAMMSGDAAVIAGWKNKLPGERWPSYCPTRHLRRSTARWPSQARPHGTDDTQAGRNDRLQPSRPALKRSDFNDHPIS